MNMFQIENQQNLENVEPHHMPSRFAGGWEYARYFRNLIELESEYQTIEAKNATQQGITVFWEDLPNGLKCANFRIWNGEDWKLHLGDSLELSCSENGVPWTGVGRVIKLPQNYSGTVGLEMKDLFLNNIPQDPRIQYSVTRVWISTSFDRQEFALCKFASESSRSENVIFNQIIGIPSQITDMSQSQGSQFQLDPVLTLPTLCEQQEAVVKNAVENSLTLVEGPAGSGKTTTLLSSVYHLVQQNAGPILVCAYTNTVVDQLAVKMKEMNLKTVRLFAETRPSEGSQAKFLTIESQIRSQMPAELVGLQRAADEGRNLSPEQEITLQICRSKLERDLWDQAEVVCCTCIAAADIRLASLKFHAILIDESMQSTEPECMIPIALGSNRLVLFGGYNCQLNPVIKCEEARERGLNRSLFERLHSSGVEPIRLTVQYRMHPNLWQFPSTHYRNTVFLNGVLPEQRSLPIPWLNPEFPFVFFDVRKGSEMRTRGLYYNHEEVLMVGQIVTFLLKGGISPKQIGVITQYVGQKNHLIQHMLESDDSRSLVEIDLVDAFQGCEKDIIIISTVRSGDACNVGSLGYRPRFHLALTRARSGLFIVGNSRALQRIPYWQDLLIFCRKNSLVLNR